MDAQHGYGHWFLFHIISGTFESIIGGAAASSPASTTSLTTTFKVTALYNVRNYQVNYGQTFSATPVICLGTQFVIPGIISTQFKNTVAVQVYHGTRMIFNNYYEHKLIYPASLNIVEARTAFLAYDPSVVKCFTVDQQEYPCTIKINLVNVINSGSGPRSQSNIVTFSFGQYNVTHTYAYYVWIAGFSLFGGTYDLAVTASIVTSTTYNLTFSTKGTTLVDYAQCYRLRLDVTYAQATQTIFFDQGSIKGVSSVQTVWPTFLQFIPTGYILGIASFSFVGSGTAPQFQVQLVTPYNILSSSGYNSLTYHYLNLRKRVCTAPDNYYYQATQLCYPTCPPYTFVNTTYNFCDSCHYSCYSCTNPTATDCTVCDTATTFRILSGTQCPCYLGYVDAGTAVCQACHFSCLTCSSAASTSCLTCGPTRLISAGSCPCVGGLNEVGVPACSACDPSCISCGGGGVCITCVSSSFFPNGTVCSLCHGSCATCSGGTSNNCLTCNPPASLTKGQCKCPETQSMSPTFQCLSCPNSILRTSCLDVSNFLTVTFLVCVAITGLLFLVGLYDGSIIPVELAHLLQMVFLAVSLVSAPPDPLVPAAQLSEFVNGYIYRSGAALASPPQLHAMNYSFAVFQNCNVMLIIEFLIAVVGLCLLKLCSSEEQAPKDIQSPDPVPQTTKVKVAKFMVYSLLLSWALFTTLGFSFAFGLYVRLVDLETNSIIDTVESVAVILVGCSTQVIICRNVIKGNIDKQLRKTLKSGTTAGYRQAPFHPAILALHRMLLGLLMGLLYDVNYRSVVILAVQLTYTLFLCVRNPFCESRMIVRQLLIQFTIVVSIVVAMIAEYIPATSPPPALIWVNCGMLLVCIISSIYCFVKERVAKTSTVQPEGQSKIQQTEENMDVVLGNMSEVGQTSIAGPIKSKVELLGSTQVVIFDVQEAISASNTIWVQPSGPMQAETSMDMASFEKCL